MRIDVEKWCKACQDCAAKKGVPKAYRAPLVPINVGGPFERVAIDIVGPLPQTSHGNKYVITFTDYLTKWPEAVPVAETSAETVARAFVGTIVARHSVPRYLLSDRGTNFLSKVFLEICKLLGVVKVNTTAYHPQTDGLLERFHRTLFNTLSMYVDKGQRDWDQYLSLALFAYRCSPQASTGESPFYLLYGRDPVLPVDLAFVPPSKYMVDLDEYPLDLRHHLHQAWTRAQFNIKNSQQQQKQFYDKHYNVQPVDYKVGQQVRIYYPTTKPGQTHKLDQLWKGPYRIEEVKPPNVVVKSCTEPRKTPIRVHVNRIKPQYILELPDPRDPPPLSYEHEPMLLQDPSSGNQQTSLRQNETRPPTQQTLSPVSAPRSPPMQSTPQHQGTELGSPHQSPIPSSPRNSTSAFHTLEDTDRDTTQSMTDMTPRLEVTPKALTPSTLPPRYPHRERRAPNYYDPK